RSPVVARFRAARPGADVCVVRASFAIRRIRVRGHAGPGRGDHRLPADPRESGAATDRSGVMKQRGKVAMSADEVAAFLARSRKLQLATINRDGTPHLVTMYYVMLDGRIA